MKTSLTTEELLLSLLRHGPINFGHARELAGAVGVNVLANMTRRKGAPVKHAGFGYYELTDMNYKAVR